MLTFDDGQMHRFVGECAESRVCDKADVHARIFNGRLSDDQLVEVLVVAGRDVKIGLQDPVSFVANSESVFGADFVSFQPFQPLDVRRRQRLDAALKRRCVTHVDGRVSRPCFRDDGVRCSNRLLDFESEILRHFADQISRSASVNAGVGGPENGKLDCRLSALVVNGLVDVLAVFEPENFGLRTSESLAEDLEGVADRLRVEER